MRQQGKSQSLEDERIGHMALYERISLCVISCEIENMSTDYKAYSTTSKAQVWSFSLLNRTKNFLHASLQSLIPKTQQLIIQNRFRKLTRLGPREKTR